MRALAATTVPVPARRVLRGPDADVLGAPFYVMERVDGVRLPRPPPTWTPSTPTPQRAGSATRSWTRSPTCTRSTRQRSGSPTSAARTGFLERQVRRWAAQLERVAHPGGARLRPSSPPDSPPTCPRTAARQRSCTATTGSTTSIVGPRPGRIRAVLDWEMATLGDPLADLGAARRSTGQPGGASRDIPIAATRGRTHGFPPAATLIAALRRRAPASTSADARLVRRPSPTSSSP